MIACELWHSEFCNTFAITVGSSWTRLFACYTWCHGWECIHSIDVVNETYTYENSVLNLSIMWVGKVQHCSTGYFFVLSLFFCFTLFSLCYNHRSSAHFLLLFKFINYWGSNTKFHLNISLIYLHSVLLYFKFSWIYMVCCHHVRFEVFLAVKIQVHFFCIVIPSSVLVGYQCFGGPCCPHHHEDLVLNHVNTFLIHH